MKKILLTISLLVGCMVTTNAATTDDDLLLMVVPTIAAAAQSNAGPVGEIRKLSGDWYFDKHYNTGGIFVDEFRFYRNSVKESDNTTATIEGDQYLSDFGFVYVDAVAGGYSTLDKFYIVVSIWGPPIYDASSIYVFKSTTKDTANFDCHFFADAQGNIRDYYKGFGGTLDCDRLTKRHITSNRLVNSNLSQDELSLEQISRLRWEHHERNEKQNRQNQVQATGQELRIISEQAEQIQSLVNATMPSK